MGVKWWLSITKPMVHTTATFSPLTFDEKSVHHTYRSSYAALYVCVQTEWRVWLHPETSGDHAILCYDVDVCKCDHEDTNLHLMVLHAGAEGEK